jgi:hypothetical protein
MKIIKITSIISVFMLIVAGVFFLNTKSTESAVTTRVLIGGVKEMQTYPFFTATTTNATSTNVTTDTGYFRIAGARNVEFYFSRGGATGPNNGSSQFRVQVTPNGTNWYDYNQLLVNSVTAGAVVPPLVGTTTISAATSTVIARMSALGFYGVRCIVLETTDGDHTCSATAEFGF